MKIPRMLHRIYAWYEGYSWLPCRICGRKYGAHEKGTGWLMITSCCGGMVCPNCKGEAEKRNLEKGWKE